MRVRAGLVTILVAAVVAGCGGSSATPTASPAEPSTPAASSPATASEQPSESSAPAETPAPTEKATAKPPSGGYTLYVVKSGDTLYAIAKRFSTTVAAIMALNPTIKDPSVIHIGQKIKIPKK